MNDSRFYPPRIFGAIRPGLADFATARAVVLPVPYDATTTYRGGARDGPQAIVDASQYVELYDPELDVEICDVGIATLPEVEPVLTGPADQIARVRDVTADLLAQGKFVVALGGEHSITLGLVSAHHARFPDLTVLQLDAHADVHDQFNGTPYSHAAVMRRVLEVCPAVQAVVRSLSLEERDFVRERGIRLYWAEDVLRRPDWLDEALPRLSEHVYVTIDLDVFDSGIMPAVGTPEPGGLGWYDVLAILRRVAAERRIVGFDVVELAPAEGPAACAYLAAKLTYKLIGYSLLPFA